MPQTDTGKYDEGILLRGTPLTNAEEWLNKRQKDLSHQERQFIEASLRAHKKSQRQKKLGIVVILVIAVVVAGVFGVLWENAETQRQKAEINAIETLNQTSKALFSHMMSWMHCLRV